VALQGRQQSGSVKRKGEILGPQPCPVAHKSAESPVLGFSGRVCVAVPMRSEVRPRGGGGIRGEVRDWSAGSRRRLLFGLGCLDFERERGRKGRWVSLTLTYGHDPGSERFRRDRSAFLRALHHRYGRTKNVWKVEFHQHWRGGVPHLHMMLLVPRASEGELRALRRWLWPTWARVSGGDHRVDARWASARVMASYVAADYTMSGRKAAQQRVPEGWGHVGRWWAINGMGARWVTRPVTYREFRVAKALIRQRYAVESGRCGSSEDWGSAWVLTDKAEGFAAQVFGFLEEMTCANV
jgi:hypothetical protein